MKNNYPRAIGMTAAYTIAVEIIIFAVSLVMEIISHSNLSRDLGYIASLLLAVSILVMMTCFYKSIQEHLKIFGLLALVSSVIYTALCSSNYFLQLTVVAFNPLNLSSEAMKIISFVPGSPAFALDMLGYVFLCLSTLAAGFALNESKDKILKVLCFIHGAIAIPTLAAPVLSGIFNSTSGQTNDTGNYVLIFWCIIFLPIALLFARFFKTKQT